MPHRERLLDSELTAANQILGLALDPEMRRIVSEVSQDRDHRCVEPPHIEIRGAQTLEDGAVEIGYQRDHEVRRRCLPEARQERDLMRMQMSYQGLRRS